MPLYCEDKSVKREARLQASAHPRVVPYTPTTAFLFASTIETQAERRLPPPTVVAQHDNKTLVPPQNVAVALSHPSWPAQQLAYLADPAQLRGFYATTATSGHPTRATITKPASREDVGGDRLGTHSRMCYPVASRAGRSGKSGDENALSREQQTLFSFAKARGRDDVPLQMRTETNHHQPTWTTRSDRDKTLGVGCAGLCARPHHRQHHGAHTARCTANKLADVVARKGSAQSIALRCPENTIREDAGATAQVNARLEAANADAQRRRGVLDAATQTREDGDEASRGRKEMMPSVAVCSTQPLSLPGESTGAESRVERVTHNKRTVQVKNAGDAHGEVLRRTDIHQERPVLPFSSRRTLVSSVAATAVGPASHRAKEQAVDFYSPSPHRHFEVAVPPLGKTLHDLGEHSQRSSPLNATTAPAFQNTKHNVSVSYAAHRHAPPAMPSHDTPLHDHPPATASPAYALQQSLSASHDHAATLGMETDVSPLSSVSRVGSPIREHVQRRVEQMQITPQDCGCASVPTSPEQEIVKDDGAQVPRSNRTTPHSARSQRGRLTSPHSSRNASQHTLSSVAVSNELSSRPSRPVSNSVSVSPPLRGRLSFDTAADDDGQSRTTPASPFVLGQATLHVPAAGASIGLHPASTPPKNTSPSVASGFVSSPSSTPERALRLPLCRLLVQEEASAREWVEMDSGTQLHHIACEERLSHRVAEAAQYRRRLQELTAEALVPAWSTVDLVTPPAQVQRRVTEQYPVGRACVSSTDEVGLASLPATTPVASIRVRRRMPSASSLPPMSPRGKESTRAAVVAEASDDSPSSEDTSDDASSTSAASDAASLSPSSMAMSGERTSPRTDQPINSACGTCEMWSMSGEEAEQSLAEEEDDVVENADDAGEAKNAHPMYTADARHNASGEDDANGQEDDEEWRDVSDGDAGEDAENAEDSASAASSVKSDENPLEARSTEAGTLVGDGVREDHPMLAQTSSVSADQCFPAPNLAAATKRRRRSPPLRMPRFDASLLDRLRDLENDEEDARYLLSGSCPPPHVFARWTERFLRGQQLESKERTHRCAVQQRDADTAKACDAPDKESPEGSAISANATRPQCTVSESPEASVSPDAAIPASSHRTESSQPAASVRSDDRSASRQRRCSERHRAWAMETLLDDVRDGGDASARTSLGRTSSISPDVAADVRAAVGSATGRYAPDPQIFDAQGNWVGAPRSCASSLTGTASPTSPASSPSCAEEETAPSPCDVTALPVDADDAAATGTPLACPTEETYEAPLGSEQEAWQALMDDFIEGIVRLISSEL